MTYAKIRISGTIELQSGLHIGASGAFAAIGATDAPVIKDPMTGLPIIPGSSLKGKIRTLLAKVYEKPHNQATGDGDLLSRLFGNSQKEGYRVGRLIFRDAFLSNKAELDDKEVHGYTEVKFENTIDRITAVATPRQIERVIRQSEFAFEVMYELLPEHEAEVEEDFQTLKEGLDLLVLDYLGGSGSRGYGKVRFKDLTAQTVFGEYDETSLREILRKEG